MTTELIISIVSLVVSAATGVLATLVGIKLAHINNLDKVHKYEKDITNFELQFKDEQWFNNLIKTDEINNYSLKSKKKIANWWIEYQKVHNPCLIFPTVDIKNLKAQFRGGTLFNKGPGAEADFEIPDVEDLF